jgi:hypothetical protein
MKMRSTFVGIVTVVICASSAGAQNKLVVRAESEARTPLTGALIALVSPSNQVVEERLTSSSGAVTFNAPAGEYVVRVRRIGYRPFYSKPITLPRSEPLILQVESPRVVLEQMVVTASSQCGKINPDAATLAALWEEISKGLRASQLTTSDLKEISRRVVYRREVRDDGSIVSSDSTVVPVFRTRPFGSPDPTSLVTLGYVRGDEHKGWSYFGPDEVVLLSDPFAATHCFRAVRDRKRPNQIGVAFQPIPKRKQSDINGVIWLNERTSELREVEFRYVNAGVLDDFRPGGFSRFRRMPSGAWIVSEWQLRMPRLTRPPTAASEVRVSETIENGGRIYTRDQVTESSGKSVITGAVFDSLMMRPLRDAAVTIASKTTRTDDRGRFVVPEVTSGSQVISISHPSLFSIGMIAIETPVVVSGDTATVSLATPSRRSVWTRICNAAPDSTDAEKKGILHGTIRDEDGRPVDEAVVTMHYKDFRPQAGPTANTPDLDLRVITDADGHYSACGFKGGAVGTMKAMRRNASSSTVEFTFDAGLIQRKDLVIKKEAQS